MKQHLDTKLSVMKHMTVTRIFLIIVLGCAAVSVYWAFRMKNECSALCTNISPKLELDDFDTRHHIVLSTATTNASVLKSSITERKIYHRDGLHKSVTLTTVTATKVRTDVRSTTMQVPSSLRGQSLPLFHLPLPADGRCTTPLFCSPRLVRNCITNEIIGQIPDDVRSQRMKSPRSRSVETSHMRRQSFKKVFDTRAWGHDWDLQHKGLNASGEGATLPWTQETIATLHSIITQLKELLNTDRIQLLDVPCGDMAWMSRFLQTRDDVDYTGVDIVPDVIHHHRQKFANRGWHFYEWDIVRDGLEFSNMTFDLILCRAMLQHLYTSDILRTLAHFSTAPFKYRQSVFLLTTTFSRHPRNKELEITDDNPGRYRPLNLELPPVSLAPPICLVRDGPPDAREAWMLFLGLWELPLHKVSDCSQFMVFPLKNSGLSVTSCVDWSLKLTKESNHSR